MANRYSKNYSNYILKKKYQYTTRGTIWERDWVTIGAQHQIEKGKRPFFGDSGFLFTDNSFPSTQKRHDFGKVVAEWLYGDVENAKSFVNQIELNYVSNDLRDFAYYGSCVELVRSSIYNIINWFPACAWKTTDKITYVVDSRYPDEPEMQRTYTIQNIVSNPFEIDFVKDNLKESDVTNSMRYMSLSNKKYEIICQDSNGQHIYSVGDYTIKRRKQSEIDNDNTNDCNTYRVAVVTIKGVDNEDNDIELTIDAWITYGNTVLSIRNSRFTYIEFRPIESVIDEYFDGLEGFERLLLRTDTTPLYKNSFIKMFETEIGIRYAVRDYVWPVVNDYCIDIQSKQYQRYVNDLIEISTDFDEMWCDNMWRNMTHESLRNYDWTYTKVYTDGDEESNIDGGNRLEKLIRIYGRVFDDLKRYIDGIKFASKISYDGYNNMPDGEISDRLSNCGWEIFSTMPHFDDNEDLATVYIDYDSVHSEDGDGKPNWFRAKNPISVTAATCDISFLRELSISSKNILKAKGTVNGIDMVMALFGIGSDINMDTAISYNEYNSLSDEEKGHYELAQEDSENPSNNIYVKKTLRYKVNERYYTTNMYRYTDEFKKKIADMVHYDAVSWFYEDPYEGVPFGDVELNGRKFIVPFYDKHKYYKGDFTFQSNGGWYKKSLDSRNLNDYEETMSYLNVVPNFESLLSVNTFSLEKFGENEMVPTSDIYYVVDPSDYINYNEAAPYNLTHYFFVMDIYNPESPDSWKPILYEYVDINDTITPEEYENLAYRLMDTDLVWEAMECPGTIVKNYGALDAYYVYICNNTVIRAIEKNDYESKSNLGYSVSNLCKVSDDAFYISTIPFQSTHDYNEMTVAEFESDIIALGKYVPKEYIWFVNIDPNMSGERIPYDQWRVLTKSEQSKYELFDVELDLALDNGTRSDVEGSIKSGKVCDFNLEKLYYESHELTQADYVHVIDLYVNDSINYVPITEISQGIEVITGYAKKYPGDIDLYERAKYLDSIISSNIGNNPHTGYGRYDLGNEFISYMGNPFKYYEDNYNLPDEIKIESYSLIFDVGKPELSQYVKISTEEYNYKPWSNGTVTFRPLLTDNQEPTVSISFDEYLELPYYSKRAYHVNEEQLIDALKEENRSDIQTDNYSFDLRKMYESDFTSIYDYVYKINEYQTDNKVKNISNTFVYEDGYTRTIDQERFGSLTEEERKNWTQVLVGVDEDGYAIYKYTHDITVSEYEEMPPSKEKDEYKKTMAKINTTNKYRDVEDKELDTPVGVSDEIRDDETYYINSKIITIEFINTNELFKQYFLGVIGKYVMQVVPSTAIAVVLFDHDNNYNDRVTDEING